MRAAAATPLGARGIVPRPTYCVIDHERRDLSVAEAACEGRFEHFGTALDLGVEPDWTGAKLPPDEEWLIAWSKFYEGLDLGHAFAETGETRFLRAWERLVSSWIRTLRNDTSSSAPWFCRPMWPWRLRSPRCRVTTVPLRATV